MFARRHSTDHPFSTSEIEQFYETQSRDPISTTNDDKQAEEYFEKLLSLVIFFIMVLFIFLSLICIFQRRKAKTPFHQAFIIEKSPHKTHSILPIHILDRTSFNHESAQIPFNHQMSYLLLPQNSKVFLSDAFNMPPPDLASLVENTTDRYNNYSYLHPPKYESLQKSIK